MRMNSDFSRPGACATWVAIGLLGLIGGCSTTSAALGGVGNAINNIGGLVTPYKMEIVQGNVLTSEQVGALQKGMSREQVRQLLGSPLITSAFHADRWDYAFTIQRQGIAAQERRYTLGFKGDLLDTFSGDTMPTETDFVATLVANRSFNKTPELVASEDRLRAFAASNTPTARPVAAPLATPRSDYPPLESGPK